MSAITFTLGGTALIAVYLWLRARREFRESFDELPTGLCTIGRDNAIERWNRQMAILSGIPDIAAKGQSLSSLPHPWPDALGEVLAAPEGRVIKQAFGHDARGRPRWFILHSSELPRHGRFRQVLVEDISDYQRLQDELLHRERLASIGRLAAGVAHEIGNPVTGIACVAQNLSADSNTAELEQSTDEILKLTDRISRTVGALMQLSHPGSGVEETKRVPCNLADCIDEAIHLLALDERPCVDLFQNQCDRELVVMADAQLLLQVFLNLLDNARSAACDEGVVLIDTAARPKSVRVDIDNPGEAIPESTMLQVFEPFFTTKDVGEGTGLGLALVRRMIEEMGGSVQLQSPSPLYDGRGVRATLTLERAEYAADFIN